MSALWTRIGLDLADRVSGPMKFRLVLQPLMAVVFAIISGLRDAKLGEPPYFWSLATEPSRRIEMLRDGWKSIGKLFVVALALDVIYQLIVRHSVYPGEVLIVAILLAIVPYLILRGLVTRLARRH